MVCACCVLHMGMCVVCSVGMVSVVCEVGMCVVCGMYGVRV